LRRSRFASTPHGVEGKLPPAIDSSEGPVKESRPILCSLISALLAVPAAAHHSGAMFDDKKTVTLSGTVKAFQWTNPHCWIQVLVPSQSGPVEWSVEMGAPFEVYRTGLRPTTLKAGDKITVVIHPVRDGGRGGLYVSATGADGKPLSKTAE
jgi:hypothetical protein